VVTDPRHPHRKGCILTAGMIEGFIKAASSHECITVNRTVGGNKIRNSLRVLRIVGPCLQNPMKLEVLTENIVIPSEYSSTHSAE
jgi:hypothetical protein